MVLATETATHSTKSRQSPNALLLRSNCSMPQVPRGRSTGWGTLGAGHIGYHLAGTSPGRLRTLTTVSAPALPLPTGERVKLEILSYVLRFFGPTILRRKIANAQLTDEFRADAATVAYINSAVRRAGGRSLANTTRSFIVRRSDLSTHASRAELPILIVATDDRGELTPAQARATAELCRDAEVAVIDNSRTLIPLEQPERLVEVLIEFWSKHDPQ